MTSTQGEQWHVNTDGGSRGNPGPSSYGAVLRAPDEALVATAFKYIGWETSNVAEYQGLCAGLRLAIKFKVLDLQVRMDSQLVVGQMRKEFRIKTGHLWHYHEEAQRLINQLWSQGCADVVFKWVPRTQNKDADRLCRYALDEWEAAYAADCV